MNVNSPVSPAAAALRVFYLATSRHKGLVINGHHQPDHNRQHLFRETYRYPNIWQTKLSPITLQQFSVGIVKLNVIYIEDLHSHLGNLADTIIQSNLQ